MSADWDEISYVISSRYRVAVLRQLSKGPAIPSQIANEADLSAGHTSRALQELREHSLVELLVSEDRSKGRLYGISESGQVVWDRIEADDLA